MRKIGLKMVLIGLLFVSCQQKKEKMKVNYPETSKEEVIDTYFGTKVTDSYRWLEDDKSKKTEDWVKVQNEVTFNYLNKIPYKKEIQERLSKLWNYERVGTPFKEGKYTYFYKNDGLQNQAVLYRKGENGKEEVFLNPNTFAKDGTTSLGNVSFTKDGSLVAYTISEGGSDWRKVIVMKTENKEIVGDTLVDVKFSGIAWKGNEGFFYSSYDKPKGSELSAKTDQHKLYYHKLGTPQKEDKVIFGGKESEKHRYVGGQVTDDGNFLIISAAKTTSGNRVFITYIGEIDKVKQKKYPYTWKFYDFLKTHKNRIEDTNSYNNDFDFVDFKDNKFYFITNYQAPNRRLVAFPLKDLMKPVSSNWENIIPETENVLDVSTGGGFIFAKYMVDAVSKVKQYDYNGKLIREVKLPGVGTAGGFGGKAEDKELYFSFQNYKTPTSSYKFNPKDGKYELYWKPAIDFNSDNYESKQVFYTSKDGTKVPMIITYKKGLELNGKNPTILYGYGGFNISLKPAFSTANAVWLELGGVYAVPNLRGGGEYGKKWHDAGTKMQKQNVFDDFISAGEYLIKEKYTSSDFLAIRGGSNGGLLVGATMTQRPDLMKVALPAVGVLDMLRYHTFTAGAGWAYDYGTAEDSKEMFEYLRKYSPVHNVKENVEYPATLITTGDHDDRVVPAHSFKFAAELQDKQIGDNPTLIRIETNAGHGAGTPVSKIIEQYADIFSFTLYNMGYDKLSDIK